MKKDTLKGLWALSPLLLFIGLYLITGLVVGDFYKLPITVAFLAASIYGVAITFGLPLEKRIGLFSKGAGSSNMMTMLWIFILAGAFSSSAKEMGAIDATVNLALTLLSGKLLLAGLFLTACLISLSIGTSVGTIVALTPIAAGIAQHTGASLPMLVAIVVGGAYFGDNLSFISDTTILATRTQECKMSDKFKVNSLIVMPAAMVVLLIYLILGWESKTPLQLEPVDVVSVLPYLLVIVSALLGMGVFKVLTLGILLSGCIGVFNGSFAPLEWFGAMGNGIVNMGELIIITLLAGGLLELIRHNGGLDFLLNRLMRHIKGKRGAEFAIASLVGIADFCTANNTVAILTVGPLAKEIANKYGVDKRKSASLLDTFSCFVQSIIPYGAQMLMAAGLAAINPITIIPYLYYPFIMGAFALLAILFRYPRKYS